MATAPFPAPAGFRWVFTPYFWHWRAKRFLYARDYNRRAWCFLVRLKVAGRVEYSLLQALGRVYRAHLFLLTTASACCIIET
jgi:hypothetical protein